MDAVPGRLNIVSSLVTRPGLFFGSCYELCGLYHGFMPVNLLGVGKSLFADLWLSSDTNKVPASQHINEYLDLSFKSTFQQL